MRPLDGNTEPVVTRQYSPSGPEVVRSFDHRDRTAIFLRRNSERSHFLPLRIIHGILLSWSLSIGSARRLPDFFQRSQPKPTVSIVIGVC